jgi:hypothetical protein
MIELSFREGVKLRRALNTAFSPSALAQVVYDQLHENLQQITGDDESVEQLVNLIVWAEIKSRTPDLIRAARTGKPGDASLLEFEDEYQRQQQAAGGDFELPPNVLTPDLRRRLVAAVMAIPESGTYQGRSAYILGLPSSPSRIDEARADLNTIFDQINKLGRLASGQWPLLLVIDNILSYVEGWPDVQEKINNIRQILEQAYTGH